MSKQQLLFECGHPKRGDEHGNQRRCKECSIKHLREYNRFRQRIIRELGVIGKNNYFIFNGLLGGNKRCDTFIYSITQMGVDIDHVFIQKRLDAKDFKPQFDQAIRLHDILVLWHSEELDSMQLIRRSNQ